MFFFLAAVYNLVNLGGALLGRRRASERWSNWPLWLGVTATSLGVAIPLYAGNVGSVAYNNGARTSVGSALVGALLGGLLCVIPLLVFYALGRLLAQRPAWLVAVWAASVVPLTFAALLVGLLLSAKYFCPPGAYECPV